MLLKTKKYDITILYKQSHPMSRIMLNKFKQIVNVECAVKSKEERVRWGAMYKPEKPKQFECDVLVNCSNWDFDLKFIKTKKYINWIHGTAIANHLELPKKTTIICQSEWQKELLKKTSNGSQIKVLPNIMDVEFIRGRAKIDEENVEHFTVGHPYADALEKASTTYLMVCRISTEKGFDRVIDFMNRPENKTAKFCVIGDPFNEVGRAIKERVQKELGDKIVFLGERENPYPYMLLADWVCCFSDFETYGLVSKEAHILEKPVIFCPYATANDQFEDDFDCWYDEFSPSLMNVTTEPLITERSEMSALQDWEELFND
jgi:glycosyltransferase involved in cell wall biosynthesis